MAGRLINSITSLTALGVSAYTFNMVTNPTKTVVPGKTAAAVYSPSVKHSNGTLYVAGQIALDPNSGTKSLVGAGDVQAETQQALTNMQRVLEGSGSSLEKVMKVTVLLETMDDYASMNEVYAKFFPSSPPARAAFAVKALPFGAKVEITCIASQ